MRVRALIVAAIAATLVLGCGGSTGSPASPPPGSPGSDPGPATPETPPAGPSASLVKDFTRDEVLHPSRFSSALGASVVYDRLKRAQKLTWASASPGQFTSVIVSGSWDFSASGLFAVDVGFDDAEAQSTVELLLRFDQGLDGANVATALVIPAFAKLPRATYTIPKSSFTVTGTAAWASVRHIEIRLRRNAKPGVNSAWLYGVWANVTARPKVLLTFDDATSTAYTTAYPIMKAAGMVGTVFAAGSLVDSDPWFMTLPQLREMYAAGWDVGHHTWTHQALSKQIASYSRSGSTATIVFAMPHGYRPGDSLTIAGCDADEYNGVRTVEVVPDATTIAFATAGIEPDMVARGYCRLVDGVSAATVRAELSRNRDWLVANGFLRAKDHLAYPYGAWDVDAIAIWRDELGGKTARVVGPSNAGRFVLPHVFDIGSPYQLPSWDLNDTATAAQALAQVDLAIVANATLIFLGHGVAASNPFSTQMLTSEFQTLIDGLAARRDEGKVDVVTVSEWFESAGS